MAKLPWSRAGREALGLTQPLRELTRSSIFPHAMEDVL